MAGYAVSDIKIRAIEIGMWWQTSAAGGLDRIFESLVYHLPAENVDVLGIVQGPDGVGNTTKGRVIAFKSGNKITKLCHINSLLSSSIDTFKPDIISSHFAFYLALALNAAGGRPVVSHFHGPWSAEAGQQGAHPYTIKTKAFVERYVYKKSAKIITLSNAFRTMLVEDYRIPDDSIAVVPGCVDVSRFNIAETKAQAREILGFPLDRPILVSVRRLVKRMGLSNLISAMQIVVRSVPDVILYIAGRGPEAEALAAQIDELKLHNHVKLIGFVPEEHLPHLYRAADINILATTALEGFGLTAIEALAAGTPSIVTPIGGLPEVVEGLSENLLFESPKLEDIANRLITVLMGTVKLPDDHACRTYALTNFSEQKAAKQTADIYRSLL